MNVAVRNFRAHDLQPDVFEYISLSYDARHISIQAYKVTCSDAGVNAVEQFDLANIYSLHLKVLKLSLPVLCLS